MPIDNEALRADILRKLDAWVEEMPEPDKPMITFASATAPSQLETVSARQLIEHVRSGTELGEEFVERWFRLALNHIMNAQIRHSRESNE